MPFKRVIDTQSEDTSGVDDTQAELARKLKEALPKLDLLVVKRYPRNTGKAKAIGLPIECKFDEVVEDAETFCREVAEDAVKIALEDAGDKRAKFQFIAYAEKQNNGARGVLFELDNQWMNPDDERPTTKAAEEIGMLRVAKDHMAGVSTEHVKLLAKTNDLVGMVVQVLGKMADANGEGWKANVEITKMKYEHDLRGAELIVKQNTARARYGMWLDLLKMITPIGERLIDVVAGKPRDEDTPSAVEVDTIFSEHAPDLRDLALAVIRAPKGDERNKAALAMRNAWEAAGEKTQQTIVIHARDKLGKDRAEKIFYWVAALFQGIPK